MFRTLGLVSACALVVCCLAVGGSAKAAPFTAIDGEGFESPAYSTAFAGTGQLEGQFADTDGGFGSVQWKYDVGSLGSAVVQSSVVASGSQAVQMDRVANSDDRIGVSITGYPMQRFMCISWDMNVTEATATPNGSFGPLFGVEANDDTIGLLRIGMLGVDAATGDVLYTDAASGLVETGEVVGFDEWNSFSMTLDYQEEKYYGFLNGSLLFSTGFESAGADNLTDAPLFAVAAAGDAASLAATGTAYFDNYMVIESDSCPIPEPSTLALVFSVLGLAGCRRRA